MYALCILQLVSSVVEVFSGESSLKEQVLVPLPPRDDDTGRCEALNDSHGVWQGSLRIGGNYTLKCHHGFEVDVSSTPSFTLVCPKNGMWSQEVRCTQIDDCAKLKNSCGPMGICSDRTAGYKCVCENGFELARADDDSGEWVCRPGPSQQGVCNGNTCGAHGICVDLDKVESSFDTGHVKQDKEKGADTYRCSCAQGYTDDGQKCIPLDCGELEDKHGVWSGSSKVGGRYSLHCREGSYIWGGSTTAFTMACPIEGRWMTTTPVCVDLELEKRLAAEKTYHYWLNSVLALVCVCTAALAAGLTMGMVSIEPFDLKVLMAAKAEDCANVDERAALQEKQKYAQRLRPILSDHHLLLVTLLLLNSVANEALPIFLDKVVPEAMAVLLSVTAVLIFGEIMPSAVFTGPAQLRISANLAWLVRLMQVLLCPLAWPIARILDRLLPGGHADDAGRYSRAELRAMFVLHGPPGVDQQEEHTNGARELLDRAERHVLPETCTVDDGYTIDGMELNMLAGILNLREKPLRQSSALVSLRPERVVRADAEVRALLNVVSLGSMSADWVIVRSEECAGSHSSLESPSTEFPWMLPRDEVLGVLRLNLASLDHPSAQPEDQVGDACRQTLEEPIWLNADDSGMAAFRLLSEKRLAGASGVLGLVVAKSNTRIGRVDVVIGSVTLESLAVGLACDCSQEQSTLKAVVSSSPRLSRQTTLTLNKCKRKHHLWTRDSEVHTPAHHSARDVWDANHSGYDLVSNVEDVP
mmetsp:Transcript_57200/g.90680  ORF Transcript_57200/g.90680 Transcript_57200/m.90680 type:complete len:755 (-) Transcript_57200:27-2291(-)